MLSEPEIVSLISFSALLLVYMMTFLKPEKDDEETALLLTNVDKTTGKKQLRVNPYLPFMSHVINSPFYYTMGEQRIVSLHLDA